VNVLVEPLKDPLLRLNRLALVDGLEMASLEHQWPSAAKASELELWKAVTDVRGGSLVVKFEARAGTE
jgi:hypothetical protein